MKRIEMPFAVKVFAPLSSSTNRLVWRYFDDRESAIKFAGNPALVKYCPGNAWREERKP